jgi:septal ring factor EnvC (AmiA/AmiB activator)
MSRFVKWSFVLIACFGALIASSQNSKSDLELKKKKLLREISETNQLIDETRKNKKLSISQLKVLNKRIEDRKKLIGVMQSEVNNLNATIYSNERKIGELTSDLDRLKQSYSRMVKLAYMNKNQQSTLMLIFSSKDFQQAYKRLYYLKSYGVYRRSQAELIRESQVELNNKSSILKQDLSTKKVLLGNEVVQKIELGKEKIEQEQTLTQLQKKEKTLKKDLEKKVLASKKLDKEIQRIIEREIEKERLLALSKSKTEKKTVVEKPSKTGTIEPKPAPFAELKVTPETKLLSGKFESNKGRLPWPVDKGIITESFGMHPHPVLKNITTYNNGINITTTSNATVKSIYDGEVTAVISIPGANMAVIVKHGEYLTVYSNLATVNVSKGQQVKAGSSLGTAARESTDGKTEAHLEIWKGRTKLNPSEWIAR